MNRFKDISATHRAVSLLLAAMSLCAWPGCHRQVLSPFEKLYAEAVRYNPEGLRVELRTRDGRSTYHLYENIPIDLLFSSSKLVTYSIELSEGMNSVGRANRFIVEPTETVFENNILPYGIMCCGSQRPYLWNEPTVLHRDLTKFIRFEKPGRYQVFYRTRRVFRGKANPSSKDIYSEQSELTASSNLLSLTILPDDPDWDTKRLQEVLERVKDPSVRAAYDRVMATVDGGSALAVDLAARNELQGTEFERACTELQDLDSLEAIEQRVMLIPKAERHSYYNSEPITSTARADRMFLAMQKRAEQAGFGIDNNYAAWWAGVLVKRDHPELFRPTRNEEFQKQRITLYAQARGEAAKQILQLLEASISRKNRAAQSTTKETIQDLRRDMVTNRKK